MFFLIIEGNFRYLSNRNRVRIMNKSKFLELRLLYELGGLSRWIKVFLY